MSATDLAHDDDDDDDDDDDSWIDPLRSTQRFLITVFSNALIRRALSY